MMKRIALIGYGAIGKDVYKELLSLTGQTKLSMLIYSRSIDVSFVETDCTQIASSFEEVLAYQPDWVVECAGQEAVRAYVPTLLEKGISVILTSVGALADDALLKSIMRQLEKRKAQLVVPSGAVGGLDYIQSVKKAKDLEIVYESRKPIAAWSKELSSLNIKLDEITHEILLFEGSAAEAAIKYPKNLNVAATLALAGIGMERTMVRAVVDPKITRNQHIIQVSSQFGDMKITISNTPSPDNPKSSWIVARSISSILSREFEQLKIR